MKFTVWTPPAQFAVEEAGYLAMALAWPDAAIEEDGYTLERSTDGINWIAVAELSANTLRYVDYGLARHTRYWYRLTAHNDQTSADPQTVQAETAAEPVSFGEEWVEGEVIQTVIDYQYDALYRLTSVGVTSYTWDANGSLLSDGVTSYTYDHANRLASASRARLSATTVSAPPVPRPRDLRGLTLFTTPPCIPAHLPLCYNLLSLTAQRSSSCATPSFDVHPTSHF